MENEGSGDTGILNGEDPKCPLDLLLEDPGLGLLDKYPSWQNTGKSDLLSQEKYLLSLPSPLVNHLPVRLSI